jgi:hypothetical protein
VVQSDNATENTSDAVLAAAPLLRRLERARADRQRFHETREHQQLLQARHQRRSVRPRGARATGIPVTRIPALQDSTRRTTLSEISAPFLERLHGKRQFPRGRGRKPQAHRSVNSRPRAGSTSRVRSTSGTTTVRACPRRLRALRVFHRKAALYGGFVWARRAPHGIKRRSAPARQSARGGPTSCCTAATPTSRPPPPTVARATVRARPAALQRPRVLRSGLVSCGGSCERVGR